MNKNYLIVIMLLFFISPDLYGQEEEEEEKKNQIWFAEAYSGIFLGEESGIMYGGSFNYQFSKNLLTTRYTRNEDLSMALIMFLIPVPVTEARTDEFAVLYGRRLIKNKQSLSFSVGPSYSATRHFYPSEHTETRSEAYGVAFEANIKWYPGKAKTPLQPGAGFKLSGNIADTYYVALSLVLGLGNHKVY